MEEDFENDFVDVESPEGQDFMPKQDGFSHQMLVHMAYTKCINSLSKEMKAGHMAIVKDLKGKELVVYSEDTRLAAISCIETLLNVVVADLQETDYLKTINNLIDELETEKKKLLTQQKEYWDKLPFTYKDKLRNEGIIFFPDSFMKDWEFKDLYILQKLSYYRKIFEQIELCIASGRYFARRKIVNRAD
jgi:hypothetical protein